MSKRVLFLCCCVCGKQEQGRQWWNRDKGYGLCRSCGIEMGKKGIDDPSSMAGDRGYHWDLTYEGVAK